jgi:hypothetical protein
MPLTPEQIDTLLQAAYDRLLELMPQLGADWRLDGEGMKTHEDLIGQITALQQLAVAVQGPFRRRQHVGSAPGPWPWPGYRGPWVRPP